LHESYASDTSRKTKLSLSAKREKGYFVGSTVPYGYLRCSSDKYKLIVDEDIKHNVIAIFKMYLNGQSLSGIAKSLNSMGILSPIGHFVSIGIKKLPKNANEKTYINWSSASVRCVIKCNIYTGDMVQGKTTSYSYKVKKSIILPPNRWIVVKNTHESIISHKMLNDAQAILNSNRKPKSAKRALPSILAGYVYCGDCDKMMQRHTQVQRGIKYRAFRCSTSKKFGKDICSSHIIDEAMLLKLVLFTIQTHASALINTNDIIDKMSVGNKIAKTVAFYQNRISELQDELEASNSNIDSLYKDYLNKLFSATEYKKMNQRAVQYSEKVQNDISNLEQKIVETKNINHEFNFITKEFLKSQEIESLTSSLVTSLIDKIYIYENKEIRIVFKYENQLKNYNSIFANAK